MVDEPSPLQRKPADSATNAGLSAAEVIRMRIDAAAHYSGPIPSAAELERYHAIDATLTDRILRMAESNAQHRQSIERAIVTGGLRAQARGQTYAFSLALITLGVGVWLVFTNQTALGLWLILGNLVALAAVFVTAHVAQARERRERHAQNRHATP
ncbi:MAG: DUF2335 domain-containing protein [Planctomycetota bacterium]